MRGALSGGAVDVDCGEEERVILLGHFYYNDTMCETSSEQWWIFLFPSQRGIGFPVIVKCKGVNHFISNLC